MARLCGAGYGSPIVVGGGGGEHRFLVADQLAEDGCTPAAIILEPEGRNTAAAIALAAHFALTHDTAAVLFAVPSDHVIADSAAFDGAVATGLGAARAGRLVTFGIAPAGPETGYGYIELGAPLDGLAGVNAVARFVEKPDAATAQAFIDGGRHAWNGGTFLFGARAYLDALAQYARDIAAACASAMAAAKSDGIFIRPDRAAFLASPNFSIDYAVMEPTTTAAVVPVEMGWSGVGSWGALWDIAPRATRSTAMSSRSIRTTASSASTTAPPSRSSASTTLSSCRSAIRCC